MNATLYYVLGASLAVLAVLTTFVGLRVPRFPGSTAVLVSMIAIFVALVGATTTFAVLNGQDEQQERAQELGVANEKVEAAEGQAGATGAGEPAEAEEEPAEAEEEPAGQEEAGEEAAKGGQEATGGPGGTLQLAADPTEIAFDTTKLNSKPGKVTIDFTNPSALEHNVAIEKDGKQLAESETIAEGKTSVSVNLKPGTYTFLCTIPGHAEAGMEGTLTVK